jgi:hypothetical protein
MNTLPRLMHRFRDEDLGPRPRIVVLGAAKLGNYVVLQPLLRGLRHKYPDALITYVGSQRTRELERLNPWIDASLPLAEQGPAALPALTAVARDPRGAGTDRRGGSGDQRRRPRPPQLRLDPGPGAPLRGRSGADPRRPTTPFTPSPSIPTGPVPRWWSAIAAGSAATASANSIAAWPGWTRRSSGWSCPPSPPPPGCRRC